MMKYSCMIFLKKLGLLFLVVLATPLACPVVKAMDDSDKTTFPTKPLAPPQTLQVGDNFQSLPNHFYFSILFLKGDTEKPFLNDGITRWSSSIENYRLVSKAWKQHINYWIENCPKRLTHHITLSPKVILYPPECSFNVDLSLSWMMYDDKTFPILIQSIEKFKNLHIRLIEWVSGLRIPSPFNKENSCSLFETLSTHINFDSLKAFHIHGKIIGNDTDTVKAIEKFIEKCSYLEDFSLLNTNMTPGQIVSIISKFPRSLRLLDLVGNKCDPTVCKAIREKLPNLPNLQLLSFGASTRNNLYDAFFGKHGSDGGTYEKTAKYLTTFRGKISWENTVLNPTTTTVTTEALEAFKEEVSNHHPNLYYLITEISD